MKKVAKFSKVSFEQYSNSVQNAQNIYNDIKLPTRATKGSAGYDFFAPFDFTLQPNQTITIATGIRAKIKEGYFLAVFPRSGLGFKYRVQLNNTVGIIDADYYNALNEGHIMSKLTNDSKENKDVLITAGNGFIQGIFLPFGITVDDESDEIRTGGFGSTSK